MDKQGTVQLRPARLTLQKRYGSVPALWDRETVDFDDQIAEAMEKEAERIVPRLKRG